MAHKCKCLCSLQCMQILLHYAYFGFLCHFFSCLSLSLSHVYILFFAFSFFCFNENIVWMKAIYLETYVLLYIYNCVAAAHYWKSKRKKRIQQTANVEQIGQKHTHICAYAKTRQDKKMGSNWQRTVRFFSCGACGTILQNAFSCQLLFLIKPSSEVHRSFEHYDIQHEWISVHAFPYIAEAESMLSKNWFDRITYALTVFFFFICIASDNYLF